MCKLNLKYSYMETSSQIFEIKQPPDCSSILAISNSPNPFSSIHTPRTQAPRTPLTPELVSIPIPNCILQHFFHFSISRWWKCARPWHRYGGQSVRWNNNDKFRRLLHRTIAQIFKRIAWQWGAFNCLQNQRCQIVATFAIASSTITSVWSWSCHITYGPRTLLCQRTIAEKDKKWI